MPLDPKLIFGGLGGTVVDLNAGNDVIDGAMYAGPTTFYSSSANTGTDTIRNFGKNDILVVDQKLYDSNNDGIITFGSNRVLDTDGPQGGTDTINFAGSIGGLRYLGTDGAGHHAYADMSVRKKGWLEGTLADDTRSTAGGNKTVLFDTALDLAWGNDTVTGFGVGDRIVTTSAIYDGNRDRKIDFGADRLLDLNGDATLHGGPQNNASPWGKVQVTGENGEAITALFLTNVETVGTGAKAVTYYYYGLADPNAIG